ncbi:DUF4234 domain-containing protein [Ruminococcaceae bacterium OttesenSCG-928-I18]|nr:DUF4234 domain-containing protein [Ruminococcaceae bacterium OttesenSCG-928-I18]
MVQRNIVLYVILTFVTCGIFGLYWFYTIAKTFEEAQTYNRVSTSAGVTLLLDIITCSIYGMYAYYKWGQATPEIMSRYGRPADDKSVLYLVLSIFGLQIVNMCLIQNDFNNLVEGNPPPPQQPYSSQTPPPPPPAYR